MTRLVRKRGEMGLCGVNPKGAGRKGALLLDVYGDLTPKENALAGSAPMVVGGGTLLVPMWLHGLVQLLMATVVRIISNSGSMAMVAKILSLIWSSLINTDSAPLLCGPK